MPNRVIKESIKRSPQIDSLTWFEEVVFYRLIVTADDYGCLDGRTVLLKNDLFPTKENITKKSIEDAVSKLVSVGLLCKYTVSGIPYLVLPTWERHQRIRNKHRKYPEPPENICETCLSANRGQMSADCLPESESNPNPIQIQSNSSALRGENGDEDEEIEIELLLNTGELYPVSKEKADRWRELYPAVDVSQELRNMAAWLEDNPARRKTKAGILRFCSGWLAREQDRGRRSLPPVQREEPSEPAPTPEYIPPTPEMDEHRVLIDPDKPFNLDDYLP